MKRGMGARSELKREIRKHLNGINPRTMLDEGRVYGGGLHKLEPKEPGQVAAAAIAALCPELAQPRQTRQATGHNADENDSKEQLGSNGFRSQQRCAHGEGTLLW